MALLTTDPRAFPITFVQCGPFNHDNMLWKGNQIMGLNLKALGYFVVLGVFAILIVIGVNGLL